MRRKTSAPVRGRPPESARRTAYASPPPSDAGARSRVTFTWGGPRYGDESLNTVSVGGRSLALGLGPVTAGASPLGPSALRRSESEARGRQGSGLSVGKGASATARPGLVCARAAWGLFSTTRGEATIPSR